MRADEVYLETRQRELLKQLIDAQRTMGDAASPDFMYKPSIEQTLGSLTKTQVLEIFSRGESVIYGGSVISEIEKLPENWETNLVCHPGFTQQKITVLQGDMDALEVQDLIRFRDDKARFHITPLGMQVGNPFRSSR